MHTFSPKSVRLTGASLPSFSFSRMNPQWIKKNNFFTQNSWTRRNLFGIFCRQGVSIGPNNIRPFAPKFRKFVAPAILHDRSWLYACKHCGIGFLLPTPKREGIYSNSFTGIIFSWSWTLSNQKFRGAACCTQQNHVSERSYTCTHCGSSFSSVIFLSRHTGERLYICEHCANTRYAKYKELPLHQFSAQK